MTEVKLNGSIDLSIPVKKANDTRKSVKKEHKELRPRVKTVDEIKQNVSNALEKVGGKYVRFDDIDHTEGLLIAGVIDAVGREDAPAVETVCFAVVDRDRNVQYVNHNEHFSVLREVSNNLSVLDYLYHREALFIFDRATNQMDADGVELFTKNYIYVPKAKPNKGKKPNNKSGKKSAKKN